MFPSTPELVSIAVNQGDFPKTLYKYRRIDSNTESIFARCELWFARFDSFNDPFDCQINDAGGYSDADIEKYLVERGVLQENAERIISHRATNPDFIDESLKDSNRKVLESWGILCLSRRRDDILMWSHYCDSHSGFVLGFSLLECPEFFLTPLNVRYAADYPTYSYLKEPEKIVTHGIITKSLQWDYEEEVRILKKSPGLHAFKKHCLTEVILGCRMADSDRAVLLEYLKKYGFDHVTVSEAKCSLTSYCLDISPL